MCSEVTTGHGQLRPDPSPHLKNEAQLRSHSRATQNQNGHTHSKDGNPVLCVSQDSLGVFQRSSEGIQSIVQFHSEGRQITRETKETHNQVQSKNENEPNNIMQCPLSRKESHHQSRKKGHTKLTYFTTEGDDNEYNMEDVNKEGKKVLNVRKFEDDEEGRRKSRSSEENHFFEGVEKLLEVWFTESLGQTKNCDLRKIPRTCWSQILNIVHCEIISMTRNSRIDAYVLSESSMFVSKRRFILKTCGTTTPLDCITELTKLVRKYTGYDSIEDITYSRKNFQRPDLQKTPYTNFEQEVAILDQLFSDGVAYCMGTLNRDCWYMYTLNPLDRVISGKIDDEPDQTIEILMTELDPSVMAIFSRKHSRDGKDATLKSGIDKLVPNMKIDDYLFDPCGYSMNGVLQNESVDYGLGEYMTIHITPEPEFSYVSFESNIPASSYLDIVERVLNTFRPGKFILTIFANRTSMAAPSHKELRKSSRFGDWMRNDIQYCSFQNFDLTYAHFVKLPS